VRKKIIFDRTRITQNLEVMSKIMNNRRWEISNDLSLAEKYKSCIKAINDISWEYHLKKEVKSKQNKCYSRRTKKLIEKRRQNYKGHKKPGFDWLSHEELTDQADKQKKRDRKENKRKYLMRGIKSFLQNRSKIHWNWLKTIARKRRPFVAKPVIDRDKNELVFGTKEIGEAWRSHFEKLSKDDDGFSKDREYWKTVIEPAAQTLKGCDDPITWEEVLRALEHSSKGKATGTDGIPIEFYKVLQRDKNRESPFGNFVFQLITEIYAQAKVPEQWNEAMIVPVPKKGDLHNMDNYRGISLINTLCKEVVKIITEKLNRICTTNKILRDEQAGFRKLEECIAQTTCFYEIVKRRSLKGKPTMALFLDFKKAYDKVPHEGLFAKLRGYGFSGRILDFLIELYRNPKASVRIGDERSDTFNYQMGVKQGCPASPTLFNLYINNILEGITGVGIGNGEQVPGLLFADDAVVFAESYDDMVHNMEILEDWCDKWKMDLNISKCGLMVFNSNEQRAIKYKNANIPTVERYRYLGIPINRNLDLKTVINDRKEKAQQALMIIRPLISRIEIPLPIRVTLIKSVLIPTATFGSELYGMSSQRTAPIQRVIDKAVRCAMACPANYCRLTAYEEIRIECIDIRAAKARTRAFIKWRNSRTTISKVMKTDFKCPKTTWYTGTARWIRRLLKNDTLNSTQEGVKKVEDALTTGKYARSKSKIREKRRKLVFGSSISNWKETVKNYRVNRGWHVLTKIRTGTFMFGYRLAKYGRISSEYKKKCIACEKHGREDGIHLLWHCSKWEKEREECYRGFNNSDDQKIRNLFDKNSQDELLEGVLLGGGLNVDYINNLRISVTVATATYLERIIGRRAEIINNLVST
ncbi:RNA-directed DNA polymerase, Non LTR Retrotransposon, partial [Trachipleistophora hominis]